jgi:hypothetical protein
MRKKIADIVAVITGMIVVFLSALFAALPH